MKQKLPLTQATKLTRKIIAELAPGCHVIKPAGSVRRKKPTVGDIEIVAIPRRQLDLFGNEAGPSCLDPILVQLVEDGRLLPAGKNGERYKQFYIHSTGTQLDLFLATPETWPVIFAIRTGGAEFSRKLVTQKAKGGLLPSDCRVADGRVWRSGTPLDFANEREFLEFCGGWVEPEDR